MVFVLYGGFLFMSTKIKILIFHLINRRSQKASFNWENFTEYLRHYPLPALQRVRKQARGVACQSNLHQWASSAMMYATEHDGKVWIILQGRGEWIRQNYTKADIHWLK